MAVPPVLAVKATQMASERVSKALTGDIYTRRWQTVKTKGKGKKKRTVVIDHEVHANAVSVGLGALAVAAAGGMLAFGLWMTQRKLTNLAPENGAKMWRLVRVYDPIYKTVIDEAAVAAIPAWDEPIYQQVLVQNAPSPLNVTIGGGRIQPI